MRYCRAARKRGISSRKETLGETEGNNHFGYPSIGMLVILEDNRKKVVVILNAFIVYPMPRT